MPATTALGTALILRIAHPLVASAFANSVVFQPYVCAELGPTTFAVHPDMADELCQTLQAYGLSVGSDLFLSSPAR